MKKLLKIIRNHIGKYLLKLLVKLKKFDTFPTFVKIFPKSTYKASSDLMKRGYLNLAYTLVKDYDPREHEKHIVNRILSMIHIKQNGLNIETSQKNKPKTKKVLFAVHNSLPYDKAGYAIRTHAIVTKLQANNIPLKVCTRAGYPWDIQKHRHLDNAIKENTIDGINYIRLSNIEKNFKKGSDLEYINSYAKELEKEVKKHDVTILHACSNYLNAHATIKVANLLKIPCIYEVRGLWHVTRLTIDPNYKTNGMFEYEEEMVRSAAIASDKVVTISEALKKLIVSWGIEERKITVIPNAVDINSFKPQEKSINLLERYNLKDKFIVGFIGSLTSYEGLELLIEAVQKLENNKKDIVLMIVGDGNEKKKLVKLATSKSIIFTGRVPHSEVQEYYSIFDVCVYPRNDYEVCRYVPPLKPLEAMAMKKAVIVSDVAPLLEMVEDGVTGLVCKADDVQSLKDKILLLYTNQELRKTIATNAFKWVKEYRSWDLMVRKYITLYDTIAK